MTSDILEKVLRTKGVYVAKPPFLIPMRTNRVKYKRYTSQFNELSQTWVEGIFDVELCDIFFDEKCKNKKLVNNIKNWLINDQIFFYNNIFIDSNYNLNCSGTIKIESKNQSLPEFIVFNEVMGEFTLQGGEFTTLYGVPKLVGGRFDCSSNKLKTLEFAPHVVGFNCNENEYCNFNCSNNEITSLINSPVVLNGDYFCYNNKLSTLEGIQSEIKGSLICNNNKLTTIKHAPLKINGNFNVSNNLLSNIDDCNSIVDDDFICKKNLILR
jgi:hypothetical protein